MSYKIKRGTTFSVMVRLSADEWDRVYPWSSVNSAILQGSRRTPLAVSVDVGLMQITLTATAAETALLAINQPAYIDLWVDRAGVKIAIPANTNIVLSVVEGATE